MTDDEQLRTFDEWLAAHKGLLFKVVRAYAFTDADRDDLFQEIAVQVWLSVPNFKGDSAVTTWLYRVALNAALNWTRGEKRHADGKRRLDEAAHTLCESGADRDPRIEWLYRQIGNMNPIDRSLTLLLLDGFSYKEMSAILGISESNVGVKAHRIKKRLASLSEKEQTDGV